MKQKILNDLFATYCNVLGITIDRSRFGKEKYITANEGSCYLDRSDPRAGNTWAICRNGENGTIRIMYGYVSAQRMAGYLDAFIEMASKEVDRTENFNHPEFNYDCARFYKNSDNIYYNLTKTSNSPENWLLSIECGEDEPRQYNYEDLAECQNDIVCAKKEFNLVFILEDRSQG